MSRFSRLNSSFEEEESASIPLKSVVSDDSSKIESGKKGEKQEPQSNEHKFEKKIRQPPDCNDELELSHLSSGTSTDFNQSSTAKSSKPLSYLKRPSKIQSFISNTFTNSKSSDPTMNLDIKQGLIQSKKMTSLSDPDLNSEKYSANPLNSWRSQWNVELNQGLVMKAEMLLLRLAKAFFIFGAPLYRLEARVQSVADHIGIPLSILPLPTSISLSFGDGTPNFWPQTFLVKGTQGLNMAKLQAADRWAIRLAGGRHQAIDNQLRERLLQSVNEYHAAKKNETNSSGSQLYSVPLQTRGSQRFNTLTSDISAPPHHSPQIEKPLKQSQFMPKPTLAISEQEIDIYLEELDKLVSQKNFFHAYYRIFCTGIIGSILFSLWHPVGWKDFLLCFMLSLFNGIICRVGEQYQISIMEVIIPMILSFVGKLLALFVFPEVCIDKVIILSCMNFFPGIAITLAMVEFASGNLVAGTVRMFYSFIRSLKLGFGVAMGSRLVHFVTRQTIEIHLACPKRPDTIVLNESPWVAFILFFPLSISINIYLLGHPKQFPVMTGVCFLGYLTLMLANAVFEKDTSVAFSAFVIGVFSHFYARKCDDIAIAAILSGIFILVPGSFGVSGAAALFMDKDFSGNTEFATQTLSNAMSISIGLYLSSLLLFPFKKKTKLSELSFF